MILAKTRSSRSRMTTTIPFSRQDNAGSRARKPVVLVLESKSV